MVDDTWNDQCPRIWVSVQKCSVVSHGITNVYMVFVQQKVLWVFPWVSLVTAQSMSVTWEDKKVCPSSGSHLHDRPQKLKRAEASPHELKQFTRKEKTIKLPLSIYTLDTIAVKSTVLQQIAPQTTNLTVSHLCAHARVVILASNHEIHKSGFEKAYIIVGFR